MEEGLPLVYRRLGDDSARLLLTVRRLHAPTAVVRRVQTMQADKKLSFDFDIRAEAHRCMYLFCEMCLFLM